MDDPRLPAIQALVGPIAAEHQMEVVELTCRSQGGQLMVRVLVDRVGGVTIQQCAVVNQRIHQALDTASLIDGSYTIEVSSPGLDRPMVTTRDFERAVGEELTLDVRIGEGRCRELTGMLLAVQPEAIVLKTLGGNITLPMKEIRTARRALRW